MKNRDESIGSVKEILSSIPDGIAQVSCQEGDYEFQVDVLPKSESHCKFSLTFSSYGTYGLCFGHGLAFEDLPLESFSPVFVVRAILQGKVQETNWLARGEVTMSEGEIQLEDGQILRDRAFVTFLGILRVGQKRKISYEPYVEVIPS